MSVTIVMKNQINQPLILIGSLILEAITTAKCTGNQEATIIIINQIIINSIITLIISHILNHIFIPNLIITPPQTIPKIMEITLMTIITCHISPIIILLINNNMHQICPFNKIVVAMETVVQQRTINSSRVPIIINPDTNKSKILIFYQTKEAEIQSIKERNPKPHHQFLQTISNHLKPITVCHQTHHACSNK